MDDTELWEMEKRFWLDGADFYESALAEGAIMVFPYPSGILDRGGIMAGLSTAPRWQSIEMSEQSVVRQGVATVLAYRATAWRRGHGSQETDEPFEALCATTYVRDGDRWLMMAHTQQPLGVANDSSMDA